MLSDSQTYNVLINGVQSEFSLTEATTKLGALFKTTPEQTERVLQTPGFIVKRSIALDLASKYKKAIEAAGGVCEVISVEVVITPDLDLPDIVPAKTADLEPDNRPIFVPTSNKPSDVYSHETVPKAIVVIEPPLPSPVAPLWWYTHEGESLGPLSLSEIRDAIAAKMIAPEDLCWEQGMPDWQPLSSIDRLRPLDISPKPLPPPIPTAPLVSTRPSVVIAPPGPATPPVVHSGFQDAINSLKDSLNVIPQKISPNNSYLGILGGSVVFFFSLFLSWTSIPVGRLALDGGTRTGWQELGFLAFLPLIFSLYPVATKGGVSFNRLLANILIAFALLGFNNILHRATWTNAFGVGLGSTLDVGFWFGLVAMSAVTVFGIAWALQSPEKA